MRVIIITDTMKTLTQIKQPDDGRGQAAAHADAASTPITSRELFDDRREIRILHGDTLYRLRITRNDKLILTK